ncbi:hypothetical protein FISHEDRAFT_61155 [Fistulina hepatica ATCC 64428]|uniref:Uncharacterized protein n=1 Tax=Fistulina hepatica ATCC 64428 TaxID=1128425 RepID=A0A0D7A3Y5_9AGAR|nr:hypothetical protein FISHEDRAFT_61155 [Fistulina hepatica ATCC 64428]
MPALILPSMKLLALFSVALAQLALACSHTQAVGFANHHAGSIHATSPGLNNTVNTIIKANDDGAVTIHNTLGTTIAAVDMTIDSVTALDDLNTAGIKETDSILQQMRPDAKAVGMAATLGDSLAANDDGTKAVHDTIDATDGLLQATDDMNLSLIGTLNSGLRRFSNVTRIDNKTSLTLSSSSASASAGDYNVIRDTLRLIDGLNTKGVQAVDDSLSSVRPGTKVVGMSTALDIVNANDSGADVTTNAALIARAFFPAFLSSAAIFSLFFFAQKAGILVALGLYRK